jgi:hypothetical protein
MAMGAAKATAAAAARETSFTEAFLAEQDTSATGAWFY